MPHIEIKYFPRELSDQEKQTIAAQMCQILKDHFGSKEEALSVAMIDVAADRWKEEVYDPQIMGQADYLVKKPGYSY
ncbi:tautomerase PptA [Entomohabitans teleogrylli]|uniref:tautomerase PptA n=1 Tax=Entomohabitans teleogrylli TaxID=1384589 RepID=UPI00073D7947|nr:tautomerase PptA [Entomohabitans teleogrylli]